MKERSGSKQPVVQTASKGSPSTSPATTRRTRLERAQKEEPPDVRRRDSVDSKESKESRGYKSNSARLRTGTAINQEAGKNIQVVARVRPRLAHELQLPECLVVLDSSELELSDGAQKRRYAVDEVFDSRDTKCSQEYFFNRVGVSLSTEALSGFNICSLAYGHTGTGKTYTMLGDGVNKTEDMDATGPSAGFLTRFISSIFHSRSEETDAGSRVLYTAEFYEVYNEQIRDLLSAGNDSQRQRPVRVHPQHGVLVEGVEKAVVRSLSDTLGLLHFGNQMRTIASTTMNQRSSRSHAIFTFRYVREAESLGGDGSASGEACTRCESTMTFVDLAGREDQEASNNKALLFREMTYINTSLFHLALLINKLGEGKCTNSLAEYRNSKLTLLLAQALGGNSRTLLIATLATPVAYFADSVSTMNFAQSVKKIKTKPIVNNISKKNVVQSLEAEIKRLKAELEGKASKGDVEQDLQSAQALVDFYKQSWEEAVRVSFVGQAKRRRFSTSLGLVFDEPILGAPGPFLTKLSNDAALQGCCNYVISREVLRIGSSSHSDVVVHGLGVLPDMCEVRCHGKDLSVRVTEGPGNDQTLMVRQNSDGQSSSSSSSSSSNEANVGRVLINGKQISSNVDSRLHHGDSIIIGFAHAFRLVIPTEEMVARCGSRDLASLAKFSLKDLSSTSAINELEHVGREQGDEELHPSVVAHLGLPRDSHMTLVKCVRIANEFVNEANEITNEVMGDRNIMFKLNVLINLFSVDHEMPEVVVNVIQRQQLGKEPYVRQRTLSRMYDGGMEELALATIKKRELVLYAWTLEKFLQRLDAMREAYEEGQEVGFSEIRSKFQREPHLNPWQESSFAQVKRIMEKTSILSSKSLQPTSPQQFREEAEDSKNSRRLLETVFSSEFNLDGKPPVRALLQEDAALGEQFRKFSEVIFEPTPPHSPLESEREPNSYNVSFKQSTLEVVNSTHGVGDISLGALEERPESLMPRVPRDLELEGQPNLVQTSTNFRPHTVVGPDHISIAQPFSGTPSPNRVGIVDNSSESTPPSFCWGDIAPRTSIPRSLEGGWTQAAIRCRGLSRSPPRSVVEQPIARVGMTPVISPRRWVVGGASALVARDEGPPFSASTVATARMFGESSRLVCVPTNSTPMRPSRNLSPQGIPREHRVNVDPAFPSSPSMGSNYYIVHPPIRRDHPTPIAPELARSDPTLMVSSSPQPKSRTPREQVVSFQGSFSGTSRSPVTSTYVWPHYKHAELFPHSPRTPIRENGSVLSPSGAQIVSPPCS